MFQVSFQTLLTSAIVVVPLLLHQTAQAQTCSIVTKDSLRIEKEVHDLFFSPGGHGIATGPYAYSLLHFKDSTFWYPQASGFLWADGDITGGCFLSEEFAHLVDEEGYLHTLQKKPEGGWTWNRQMEWSPGLMDIDFKDFGGTFVLAYVGRNGGLLLSNEHTSGMDTLDAGTAQTLYAVEIISKDLMVVCGKDVILETRDGGQTWQTVAPPAAGWEFTALDCLDEDRWILGADHGGVIVTHNGGQTWQSVDHNRLGLFMLHDVAWVDDTTLYACGGQEVIVSLDGGGQWYTHPALSDKYEGFRSMAFIGDSAYFATSQGDILKMEPGSNLPPIDITLSDTTFFESGIPGNYIGLAATMDQDKNELPLTLKERNDHYGFQLKQDSLFDKLGLDHDVQKINSYTLVLKAEDQCGYSLEKTFTLEVLPHGAYEIKLSREVVPLDSPQGSFVALLTSSGYVADSFHYALVPGSNDADNTSFTIRNDSLLTAKVFTTEDHPSLQIRIASIDSRENVYEEAFFLVTGDVSGVESNALREGSLVHPNPVQDLLRIHPSMEGRSYWVVDAGGRIVLDGRVIDSQLRVSDLSPGIYQLVFPHKLHAISTSFIVK